MAAERDHQHVAELRGLNHFVAGEATHRGIARRIKAEHLFAQRIVADDAGIVLGNEPLRGSEWRAVHLLQAEAAKSELRIILSTAS